jgi:Rieske Fe-S protein
VNQNNYQQHSQGEKMKMQAVSRRKFMSDVGKDVLAVALLSPAIGSLAYGMSKSQSVLTGPIILDLDRPENKALTQVGGAMKVANPGDSEHPIIVSRISETVVAAFSSRCTHLGCEVPIPENGVIVCQCHKSRFDASGMVTHGPANKRLHPFDATLTTNLITIKESAGS